MLAAALADAVWLRTCVTSVLVLALVTLFARIAADVVGATRQP